MDSAVDSASDSEVQSQRPPDARRGKSWRPHPAFLVPIAALISGSTVLAQTDTTEQFFRAQDRNGDGFLSRAEWRGSGASFLSADTDRNGYVIVEELAAARERDRRGRKAKAADDGSVVANPRVSLGRFSREVLPDLQRICTSCHDLARVLDVRTVAGGFTATVERMRQKEDADFDARTGARIAEFLESERLRAIERVSRTGSADPRREWGAIFEQVELAAFDRDRSGDLGGGELTRVLIAACDHDGDGELNEGEFALLPVSADRRAEFRRQDKNRNGRLTVKELGVPGALLDQLDADRDGALSIAEVPRVRRGPFRLLLVGDAERTLELGDRNRDGELSARELGSNEDALRLFDRDGNNQLSREELEDAITRSRGDLAAATFDDLLSRYDFDGDGEVSLDEFPGPAFVLTRCDRNGDGVLSAKDAPRRWTPPDDSGDSLPWRRGERR